MIENIVSTVGSVVGGVLMGSVTIRLVGKNGTYSKFKQIYEHARYKFSSVKMKDIAGFAIIGNYTLDEHVHEANIESKASLDSGLMNKEIKVLNGKIKILTTLLFETIDSHKKEIEKIHEKFACEKPVQSPQTVIVPPIIDSTPPLSKSNEFKFSFDSNVKPNNSSAFKFDFTSEKVSTTKSNNVGNKTAEPIAMPVSIISAERTRIIMEEDFGSLLNRLKPVDKSTPESKEESTYEMFHQILIHLREKYKDNIDNAFIKYIDQYSYKFPVTRLKQLFERYREYSLKMNMTPDETTRYFFQFKIGFNEFFVFN